MSRFRTVTNGVWRLLSGAGAALAVLGGWAAENAREIVFAAGLVLMSSGLALVCVPAALIVPGAILTWLAIPAVPRARKS